MRDERKKASGKQKLYFEFSVPESILESQITRHKPSCYGHSPGKTGGQRTDGSWSGEEVGLNPSNVILPTDSFGFLSVYNHRERQKQGF